jgi:hypothetical protein
MIACWKRDGRELRVEEATVLVVFSAGLMVAGWKRVKREWMVEESTVLVVVSADLVVAGGRRMMRERVDDEVTVAVGSVVMVVFSAGLANADWKRVARELRVIETIVLVVAVGSAVNVGSSGNVARLSWLKSVAQASSILLTSEAGMGLVFLAWKVSIRRSRRASDERGAVERVAAMLAAMARDGMPGQ